MRDGNAKFQMSERGSALRKRAERERMRELGFKVVQVWVHAEDYPRVNKLVTKLRAARMREEE
jgi:hypothetical protein